MHSELHSTDPPPKPVFVSLNWDERGPTAVVVTDDWLRIREGDVLVQQIREAVEARLGPPRLGNRLTGLSIEHVPLAQLPEFTALLREARSEQRAEPEPVVHLVSSRHCAGRWSNGRLLALTAEAGWLKEASRQQLSDEFVEVLNPPNFGETSPATAARSRLARFMKEYR